MKMVQCKILFMGRALWANNNDNLITNRHSVLIFIISVIYEHHVSQLPAKSEFYPLIALVPWSDPSASLFKFLIK